MNEQVSYYQNEVANSILERVSKSVTFCKSNAFPRMKHWNKFTEEIPSTKNCSADLKKYYYSKVVDEIVRENLEEERVINTNPQLAEFYPIKTPTDGNCLCHAVSLYLWGIPDRNRFLRQILYITMVTDENNLLQRLYMQHVANLQYTVENFSTSILSKQWDILVKEAQEIPATSGSNHLEPLEAIHIFILANILLRPIVVLSSPVVRTVFNDTIQTDDIGGIYLPLLCNPEDTEKSPIVLGYHMNHFVPLLNEENSGQKKGVPLKQFELVNLPVHFFQDTLPNKIARKLSVYLKIDKATESAMIGQLYLPKHQNMFHLHFEHCKAVFNNMTPSGGVSTEDDLQPMEAKDEPYKKFVENHSETIHILASSLNKSPSFCINDCGMYGSAELGNKCSRCFSKDTTLSAEARPKIAVHNKQYKPLHEDVMGHINTKKIRQLSIKEVTPKMSYQDPSQAYKHFIPADQLQEPHQKSVHDHKHKQFHLSHNDFQPAVFLGKREPPIGAALYRHISQQAGVASEQTDLETATCVTPGCQMKAYRNMEYRCVVCSRQQNYQIMGEPRLKPVPERHSSTGFGNHSQVWDYHIRKLNQTPDLTSTDPNPKSKPNPDLVHRNDSETQVNTQINTVSLLDLLCLNDNCPNRRASALESMCTFCLRKNGAFNCSVRGCNNKQGQNLSSMCDNCFRNNELQKKNIQADKNTINYMPHTGIHQANQEKRSCVIPNCINSGTTETSGYCLQCFRTMERPEPSAPSFHK